MCAIIEENPDNTFQVKILNKDCELVYFICSISGREDLIKHFRKFCEQKLKNLTTMLFFSLLQECEETKKLLQYLV